MTLTQLEYFLALYEHRHFKQAAQSCGVTQPSLSMQIQRFEDELDTILFDRSKNPILPTPEGEVLAQQARLVLREAEKLKSLAQKQKNELEGELRLAVIPTLAPYVLPLFITSFVKTYPQLKLTILEYQTDQIIKALQRDQIDVGLLVTPLKNSQLIERPLFYERFLAFLSQGHTLEKKKELLDTDLKGEELWLLTEGHCFRNQMLKICSHRGSLSPKHKNLHFESGDLETLKNMVLNGNGVTLLPALATLQLPHSQKKQLREFHSPIPVREVSLVTARSFYKERAIIALEQAIIQHLPPVVEVRKSSTQKVIGIT